MSKQQEEPPAPWRFYEGEIYDATGEWLGGTLEALPAVALRRATVCVNACAGLPTSALEAGVVVELRAACEELLANYERDAKAVPGIGGSPHVQHALELGRAALARSQPARTGEER